ncbi:hypothetical protein PAXINDRAFT_179142 [Paxillus involutus ATCC 200175]|nr:hypothetical protein PAXINDRAFT_179142 [Paxillus involutus ATCC 200175]
MWYSGSEEAMNVDGMMLNDDAYVTRKVSLMEWHAGEIKDRVLGDNIGDEDKPSTADLVEIWSESVGARTTKKAIPAMWKDLTKRIATLLAGDSWSILLQILG